MGNTVATSFAYGIKTVLACDSGLAADVRNVVCVMMCFKTKHRSCVWGLMRNDQTIWTHYEHHPDYVRLTGHMGLLWCIASRVKLWGNAVSFSCFFGILGGVVFSIRFVFWMHLFVCVMKSAISEHLLVWDLRICLHFLRFSKLSIHVTPLEFSMPLNRMRTSRQEWDGCRGMARGEEG